MRSLIKVDVRKKDTIIKYNKTYFSNTKEVLDRLIAYLTAFRNGDIK